MVLLCPAQGPWASSWKSWIGHRTSWNIFRSHIDQQTLWKNLKYKSYWQWHHTSFYDKHDDFGFPIVNFPWSSGDVPSLPSYVLHISQLVRFAMCFTSALVFHFKNLHITLKLSTQGYCYKSQSSKTILKVLQIILWAFIQIWWNFFQEYIGISHSVFYGDLVYKSRK